MSLDNIQDIFDFDNFDYFYHETSKGDAQTIMQQGLLVDGTNIIDTNNILFRRCTNHIKNLQLN